MTKSELWVIDPSKQLRTFIYPISKKTYIPKEGRFYLKMPNQTVAGVDTLYNLNSNQNLGASVLDTINGSRASLDFRQSDLETIKTYDALRRSGWVVGHVNRFSRVKDQPERETIDHDLYIQTNEISDKSNLLCFVNGLYHRYIVDQNTGDLYIIDGAQTLRNGYTQSDITIIDFAPSGGIISRPIDNSMILNHTKLSKSFHLDISSTKRSLSDYTPFLIVDGYWYAPGITHRSITDKTLEVTVSGLNLLYNYLTSSLLRTTPLAIPITDGVNTISDMHDTDLDIFMKNITVQKTYMNSEQWTLSRLLSPHSAVVLVPKDVVSVKYPVQNETDEPWWSVFPSKQTQLNTVLNVEGKLFSPLYIHTKGYRDRTLLCNPYREKKQLWSLNDPNGTVVAAPDRDVVLDKTFSKMVSLMQWKRVPVLSQFK